MGRIFGLTFSSPEAALLLVSTKNRNLVPRAHVPFGQHQDTELWNNQQARSQSLRGFDTIVLSKPDYDFPSLSSAY